MSPDRKSLAATASDQIRAIIEAAEQTAAQIRAEAEEQAERVRREAQEEASGIRSDAREDVLALLESIRSAVSQLSADLERLGEKLQPAPAPSPEPVPAATEAATDADIESARLVALNMALDGNASREDIDRYLSENFKLADPDALLDEVYATLGR
jgi:predicted house-cleaning noncanonical NTP pyrophosphatase (MazG superfamily)